MAEQREMGEEQEPARVDPAAAEEAVQRAARRMMELPEDVLRVGGGTDNFGRGDRSMFDPAAEEDPEDPDALDGSLRPEEQ